MNGKTLLMGSLACGMVALALLMAVACGNPEGREEPVPSVMEPTATPLEPTPTPPLFAPTVVGWPPDAPDHSDEYPEPPYHYAANPSVNEQIYFSDAIVWARLTSSVDNVLTFQVLEYLKGSGPDTITIGAMANRDTSYDDRDAILFLTVPAGASSTGSGRFEFTESVHDTYRGGFPGGHGINEENRAWIPATSSEGSGEAAGGTLTFDPGAAAPGRLHEEPLTVAQIKETIAWMSASADEAYQSCIRSAVHNEAYYRMYAAYYGETYRAEAERVIASGLPTGTIVWFGKHNSGPEYGIYWIEGKDSSLFSYDSWDDDENPRNFYQGRFTTVRPLPEGTYSVSTRSTRGEFKACDYIPQTSGRLYWTITVTAPPGTLHEAFFDPMAIGAGVGADSSNGTLSPTGFTVGGTSTGLQSLKWEGGNVSLTLSPYASLSGSVLDFIELDGTVSLSLAVSDAAVDGTAGMLAWSVTSQPWRDGDQLMLRVRETDATPVPTSMTTR